MPVQLNCSSSGTSIESEDEGYQELYAELRSSRDKGKGVDHSFMPQGPRSEAERSPKATRTPQSKSSSRAWSDFDLSIVVALVSPIGNWLTGSDHIKNLFLIAFLIFYLHQLIEGTHRTHLYAIVLPILQKFLGSYTMLLVHETRQGVLLTGRSQAMETFQPEWCGSLRPSYVPESYSFLLSPSCPQSQEHTSFDIYSLLWKVSTTSPGSAPRCLCLQQEFDLGRISSND